MFLNCCSDLIKLTSIFLSKYISRKKKKKEEKKKKDRYTGYLVDCSH